MADSDVEAFLKSIDADDDDDGDSQGFPADSGSNPTIKKIRDWGEGQRKIAKELSKEVKMLREFKNGVEAEKREVALDTAFKDLGLSEKQKGLYTGEADPEAIKTWAVEFGLAATPAAGDEGEGASDGAADTKVEFTPGAPSGDSPDMKVYSGDDALELAKKNPALFDQMYKAGRVQLPKLDGNLF